MRVMLSSLGRIIFFGIHVPGDVTRSRTGFSTMGA